LGQGLLLAILLVLAAAPAEAQEAKRIALSFDDVPRFPGAFMTPDERTITLIEALKEAGVEQAAFFVTTGNLEQDYGRNGEARIRAYVEAGHVIANHSRSHTHLSDNTVADYVADLDQAAAWLEGRPGARPWYRFPYLDEGHDGERRDAVPRGAAGARPGERLRHRRQLRLGDRRSRAQGDRRQARDRSPRARRLLRRVHRPGRRLL
jgi:peptidoglycan/xylan/chitin deacetylase (PgdA/CDA1 family)